MSADREREALAWLYSFADQERGVGWNPAASADLQWNLRRVRALLERAGSPDGSLRVVLVAGTKGKGSTAALLASILDAAGSRVGLFTKPHLQSYRERVRVGGAAIGGAALAERVDALRPLAGGLPGGAPTTFELTAVLAVAHFAERHCRFAVMEVGLGGRLDATNALEPELSVITSIGRDHTAILGRTLGAIAREKAGVLRRERPALLAPQRPAAATALAERCRACGARCATVPPLDPRDAEGLGLTLAGAHQLENAALAVAAGLALGAGEDAVRTGVSRLRWPGRFEVVGDVVLDGAHNDSSAAALARTLRAHAGGREIHLVLGLNRDKDARAVLRPLLGLARSVHSARASGSPRALDPASIAALCGGVPARAHGSVAAAVEAARVAAAGRGIVCVTGSLALVGEAREVLGLPIPERLWD